MAPHQWVFSGNAQRAGADHQRIIVIILIELGLITPPVGVNVFTVKAARPDLKLMHIFIGVGPFVLAMLVTAGLILAFPGIATGLPNLMR